MSQFKGHLIGLATKLGVIDPDPSKFIKSEDQDEQFKNFLSSVAYDDHEAVEEYLHQGVLLNSTIISEPFAIGAISLTQSLDMLKLLLSSGLNNLSYITSYQDTCISASLSFVLLNADSPDIVEMVELLIEAGGMLGVDENLEITVDDFKGKISPIHIIASIDNVDNIPLVVSILKTDRYKHFKYSRDVDGMTPWDLCAMNKFNRLTYAFRNLYSDISIDKINVTKLSDFIQHKTHPGTLTYLIETGMYDDNDVFEVLSSFNTYRYIRNINSIVDRLAFGVKYPTKIRSFDAHMISSISSPLAMKRFLENVTISDISCHVNNPLLDYIILGNNIPFLRLIEDVQLRDDDHYEVLPFTIDNFKDYSWFKDVYETKALKDGGKKLILDWGNKPITTSDIKSITREFYDRMPNPNNIKIINTTSPDIDDLSFRTFMVEVDNFRTSDTFRRKAIIRNREILTDLMGVNVFDPYKVNRTTLKYQMSFMHCILDYLSTGVCINHKGRSGNSDYYGSGSVCRLIENMNNVDVTKFANKVIRKSFYTYEEALKFKTCESRLGN